MTFYSYENLWLIALGNSKIMVSLFKELVAGTEGYAALTGDDFIVHQGVVTQNPYNLTDQQLAEYLGICALRNYQDYRLTGLTDLEIAYVPEWIPQNVIINNPLLSINKSTILFHKEK